MVKCFVYSIVGFGIEKCQIAEKDIFVSYLLRTEYIIIYKKGFFEYFAPKSCDTNLIADEFGTYLRFCEVKITIVAKFLNGCAVLLVPCKIPAALNKISVVFLNGRYHFLKHGDINPVIGIHITYIRR